MAEDATMPLSDAHSSAVSDGRKSLKILSCGAGMQSTALALMSCENAIADQKGYAPIHPKVPVYDDIIFCDLGMEPSWVLKQVEFIKSACDSVGIRFIKLESDLYGDLMKNFGERRTISIPWWTLSDDGKKSKMPRYCTLDYKVEVISRYIRHELLGYKKWQRLKVEDQKAHEMHMGFSAEEQHRCKENPNPMFVNQFPLVEMGWTRAESYAYILDVWGLDTKASACTFCPFHQNYFFKYLKENHPDEYAQLLEVDHLLRDKNPKPPMDSDLFISRSRKRIEDLLPEECEDAKCFWYREKRIWNGF